MPIAFATHSEPWCNREDHPEREAVVKKILVSLFAALTVAMVAACGTQPKDSGADFPAPTINEASKVAVPTPAEVGSNNELQACEGKAGRDACDYTGASGQIKGTCVRTQDQSLVCTPKKSKKR